MNTTERPAASRALLALSLWIDSSPSYQHCDPETVLWRRVTKVASESGEAIDALAGAVGENPRKGITGTLAEVEAELLDVAVAALGAVEHLHDNDGSALDRLNAKIFEVANRAGLIL